MDMKKTIFRLTNAGLVLAAVIAFGAVAGLAQDPCTDAAGLDKMQTEFDDLYKLGPKNVDARRKAIESGKAFIEKYGNCPAADVRSKWLRDKLPGMEKGLQDQIEGAKKAEIIKQFNDALTASGSTDAAKKKQGMQDAIRLGNQILSQWPDEFRPAELAIATMAGDEAVIRNNDLVGNDAISWAKRSIADLEAGKTFAIDGKPAFGISNGSLYNYSWKDKNTALGWMNLYIGSIMTSRKDKAGALPYLYKSTQLLTDQPSPYALIANYYIDQLNTVVEEIDALKKQQDKPGITEDEIKALVEQIKAKVAMSNGITERIADAYARAYKVSTDAAYKAKMKTNLDQAYFRRFGKNEGVDAWMSSATARPFVDPTTPIQPISDPEPAKTSTSGETATTSAPVVAKPVTNTMTTTPAVKPVTTTPAKSQAPAKTTATKKPGVSKKPVAKRGA
jgi:hypothetical protein